MSIPHIISAKDFNRNQLNRLFEKAKRVKKWLADTSCWTADGKYLITRPRAGSLMGQTMALLFDQPSLRTSSSFETAMYALGGNCITFRNASRESSIAKDESLEDTIEMLSGNPTVSILVLRHPEVGAAERAASVSSVPVINAGDSREHPTQALVDLFTIQEAFDKIDGLRVTFIGDMAARTARSLRFALALYKDVRICEIDWQNRLFGLHNRTVQASDVLYVLRPQQENWHRDIKNQKLRKQKVAGDLKEYYKLCTVDNQILAHMPKNSIVLHPRPRGPELPTEVDSDPRVLHARQGRNGGPVRIALLEMLHSGEWAELLK